MTRPRRLRDYWRTGTVRLAALFATIFGLVAAGLIVSVDIGIARFAEQEAENALRHQMTIMRADADLEGSGALINILREHSSRDELRRYTYLVVAPGGETYSTGLPETIVRTEGFQWVDASGAVGLGGSGPENLRLLVLGERAADGAFIAVGRDGSQLENLRASLTRMAFMVGAAFILFAIIAGLALGVAYLRRLDRINAVVARIIDGNFTERMPAVGLGHEFDDLAANLNRMLERLDGAMQALRQVSADIAHDLRTPLTRLRNRLEEAVEDRRNHQASTREALEELDETLAIFDALLRIARVEGGNGRSAFREVELASLVEAMIDAYAPAADETGRRLLHDLSGPCPVQGDPALITQMLANLIDNALSHTTSGTNVVVAAERIGQEVVLSVRDNGSGVPDPEIPNLTKRFYRLEQSRNSPGTGLGLTLVAAIADLHGARLELSNLHPGLLATIRFPDPRHIR